MPSATPSIPALATASGISFRPAVVAAVPGPGGVDRRPMALLLVVLLRVRR